MTKTFFKKVLPGVCYKMPAAPDQRQKSYLGVMNSVADEGLWEAGSAIKISTKEVDWGMLSGRLRRGT
jgi:hypothetical protein